MSSRRSVIVLISLLCCLYFLQRVQSKALISESSEACGELKRIYIQWRSPVSGWFDFNHTIGRYEREAPLGGDKHQFYASSNGWILKEWNVTFGSSVRYTINNTAKSPLGIGLKPGRSTPFSTNLRKPVIPTTSGTPYSQSSSSTTETSTQVLSQRLLQGVSNQASVIHSTAYEGESVYIPSFQVFCPGKCLCKTAYSAKLDKEFTRSDISVNSCEDEISWVNKSKVGDWDSEIYLSRDCEFLYFDNEYQFWTFYDPWNHPTRMYINSDSGPCIELLPEKDSQLWFYFKGALRNPDPEFSVECISWTKEDE